MNQPNQHPWAYAQNPEQGRRAAHPAQHTSAHTDRDNNNMPDTALKRQAAHLFAVLFEPFIYRANSCWKNACFLLAALAPRHQTASRWFDTRREQAKTVRGLHRWGRSLGLCFAAYTCVGLLAGAGALGQHSLHLLRFEASMLCICTRIQRSRASTIQAYSCAGCGTRSQLLQE